MNATPQQAGAVAPSAAGCPKPGGGLGGCQEDDAWAGRGGDDGLQPGSDFEPGEGEEPGAVRSAGKPLTRGLRVPAARRLNKADSRLEGLRVLEGLRA